MTSERNVAIGKNSPAREELQAGMKFSGYGAWRSPTSSNVYHGKIFQAMTVDDISSITAQIILEEVFGLVRQETYLMSLVTPKPMPKLVMSYYVATQGSADRKVPKGKESEFNTNEYTKVDMECWKNVSHVALFDEDQMEASIDVFGLGKEDAALALGAARNLDIGDELAKGSETSGSDWGDPDNNPITDIGAGIAAMTNKTTNDKVKAKPRVLGMHPDVWADFIGNPNIASMVHAGLLRVPTGETGGSVAIPLYPNLSILIDSDISPSTSAYVIDPHYFLAGIGPQQSVGYRHELAGYDGHIIRDYFTAKLVSGATKTYGVRELTGVHA